MADTIGRSDAEEKVREVTRGQGQFARRYGPSQTRQIGLALVAAQIVSPFVLRARAADAVRIGLDNPLTGTVAVLGKHELIGCQMALEEINAKGGILGRPVELIVEDSTSGDAGAAVQKARKLIESDKVDFLLGNVNSAMALAMAQVSNEKGVLHIVPGGHTDAITGASCHWNVFRVCNTTQMEANAVARRAGQGIRQEILLHYARLRLRPHARVRPRQGARRARRREGRRRSNAARQRRLLLLPDQGAGGQSRTSSSSSSQGDDMLNALKQAVQFGLQNKVHLAGAQQEMEPLEGLPPEARIGTWVMEWYWNQPGVPHVAEFVEAVKKRTGRVPTARTWFGYVSTWTCAHAANAAKSLKAVDMAKTLQDFHLPPEIALGPNPAFYRAGQNQLIASLFVGDAQASGSAPDDLFKVTKVVNGADVAGTVEESGCKMTWPT